MLGHAIAALQLLFLAASLVAQDRPQTPERASESALSPDHWETGVAAYVNRDVITRAEVWNQIGRARHQSRERQDEAFFQKVLQMIEDRAFDQAADRLRLVINPEAVRSYLEAEKERVGGEEAFRESLLERGQTEEQKLIEYAQSAQRSVLFRAQTGDIRPLGTVLRAEHVIEPTGEEIRRYYRQNRDREFRSAASAKVRVISFSRSRFEDPKMMAEQVRENLLKGADFGTMADRYSNVRENEGGDLGWIDEGSDWAPEIIRYAFEGEVGEVSNPLPFRAQSASRGPSNYILVLVEDRKPSRTVPFDEAQREIRKKLRDVKAGFADTAVRLKILREAYIEPVRYKQVLVGHYESMLAALGR